MEISCLAFRWPQINSAEFHSLWLSFSGYFLLGLHLCISERKVSVWKSNSSWVVDDVDWSSVFKQETLEAWKQNQAWGSKWKPCLLQLKIELLITAAEEIFIVPYVFCISSLFSAHFPLLLLQISWTHHFLRETCLDRMEIFCAWSPFPGEQVRNQVEPHLYCYSTSLLSPRGLTLKLFTRLSLKFSSMSKSEEPVLTWSLGPQKHWLVIGTQLLIYLQKYCFFFDMWEKCVLSYKTMGKIILGFIMPLTQQDLHALNASEKLIFSPLFIKTLIIIRYPLRFFYTMGWA